MRRSGSVITDRASTCAIWNGSSTPTSAGPPEALEQASGLTVGRGLAEAHGGALRLGHPPVGGGCVFRFTVSRGRTARPAHPLTSQAGIVVAVTPRRRCLPTTGTPSCSLRSDGARSGCPGLCDDLTGRQVADYGAPRQGSGRGDPDGAAHRQARGQCCRGGSSAGWVCAPRWTRRGCWTPRAGRPGSTTSVRRRSARA